jgi:hypothetical protein
MFDKENMANLNTSILLRIKENILKRIKPGHPLTKDRSKLLLDVLGELDHRKYGCS